MPFALMYKTHGVTFVGQYSRLFAQYDALLQRIKQKAPEGAFC